MTVAFAARGSSPFGTGHPHLVARRMLAGHPHLSGVPHPLLHVVRSALDPDPARRPTAADLVEALDLQEQRYAGRDAVLGLAVAEAHGTTPATMTAGFAPPTLIELTSPAPTAAHTTAGPHPGRPRPKLRRVALIGCAALALGLVLVGGRDLSAPSTADGAPAPQVSRSPSASPAPVARPATPTAQRTTPRAAAAPAGQHGPKAHKHKHGHPG